jgi:hypothetical protein
LRKRPQEEKMASTTDMNIVLGQGNSIKEVHNVRKQNLELNQQFVAQKAEEEKKDDKAKVKEFDSASRLEIKADEEKKKRPKDNKKGPKKKKTKGESSLSEGRLIDIRV